MRLTGIAASLVFAAAACALAATPGHAQQSDAPAPNATGGPVIPSPKPAPEDAKIHKLAVQQFLAWQTGAVDRTLYSDQVNADMTDDLMDKGTKTLANLGALQQAQFQGISSAKGTNFYVYKMTCANGTIQMDFSIDPDGKIGLIFFE
jgi:hypothetical protein